MLVVYSLENSLCIGAKLLGGGFLGNFLYYYYILLTDADNVVLGLVGDKVLNYLIGCRRGRALEFCNDNGSVFLVCKVKLV